MCVCVQVSSGEQQSSVFHFLDGFESDLKHGVTQLSPTVRTSGAMERFVGVSETQVDVNAFPVPQMAEPVSTVPSSSEIGAAQNHAQVVVPAPPGEIPFHNNFEDDVPIDVFSVTSRTQKASRTQIAEMTKWFRKQFLGK